MPDHKPPAEAGFTLELRIENDQASLAVALRQVQEFLDRQRLEPDDLSQVMVIVDELAANTIAYAWPEGGAHGFDLAISLLMEKESYNLLLTKIDDGVAFDPTVPMPPVAPDLGNLKLGGLGLLLVRRTSDQFTYSRQDERNYVRVVKRVRRVLG